MAKRINIRRDVDKCLKISCDVDEKLELWETTSIKSQKYMTHNDDGSATNVLWDGMKLTRISSNVVPDHRG